MADLHMNGSHMNSPHMNRRDAIASLLAISAAGALAACGSPSSEGGTADVSADFAGEGAFFSAAEMAAIAALADTIVPDTDTPGAVAAGVPATLQRLASDWGDDDYRRYMRGGLAALSDMMRREAGQDVASMQPKMRENVLARYDAKVFEGGVDDGFYRDFKDTVVTAYYMSEIGASEELAYESVPGEWIGCVSLEDYPKTWAT